jgi:endonuclease-8
MPEGDTIHAAARRIRAVLEGRVPDEILTPQARHGMDHWPERLAGRPVRAVEARGKHLLLRFEGGLTLLSHLKMTGWWGVYRRGQRWGKSPRRAWLVLRTAQHEVVQFGGPVLELLTDARTRSDPRLAQLGPDVLAPDFDRARFLRRLREDDPTRPIGDALLDQRTIAGIGNLWKAEGCFEAGLDPWRPTGSVSDLEAMAVIDAVRPRMRRIVEGGSHGRAPAVYRKSGLPCPRCGAPIQARGQGDDNRMTYWCARCQR